MGERRNKVETWRVVCKDETREVACATDESGKAWLPGKPETYVVSDDGPREAACMLAAQQRWPVAAILAPGEKTREEAIAEAETIARREGAAVMRDRIMRVAVEHGFGDVVDTVPLPKVGT